MTWALLKSEKNIFYFGRMEKKNHNFVFLFSDFLIKKLGIDNAHVIAFPVLKCNQTTLQDNQAISNEGDRILTHAKKK